MSDHTVAILFARTDSNYKSMPECDVYDEQRDARTYAGMLPVIAHPPCRLWGRLRHMSTAPESEKELARWAVRIVQINGGVLEHPAGSMLWADQDLPLPRRSRDRLGGCTVAIDQFDFGHQACKATWFYIVGFGNNYLPRMQKRQGAPTHVIARDTRGGENMHLPHTTKPMREHTPPDMARWLVDVAAQCHGVLTAPSLSRRIRA